MSYADNQGTKIYYEVHGDGEPLVLLSGLLGSVAAMHEFGYIEALKGDYKIIAIDYRGAGKSDLPHDNERYSIRLLVEDIIAVLDRLGIEQSHVYAHSMGGWVLYGLAKYYPERLCSLIISDGIPGSLNVKELRELREWLDALDEFVNAREEITQPQKDLFLANDMVAIMAMVDWIERDQQSLAKLVDEVAPTIQQRVLLLMSNLPEDEEDARQMRHTAKVAKNAELHHFKELDHFQLYFRIDLVMPLIIEFLAKTEE
jgi:pimeloyl-ACP methyl ester carboxylesterase